MFVLNLLLWKSVYFSFCLFVHFKSIKSLFSQIHQSQLNRNHRCQSEKKLCERDIKVFVIFFFFDFKDKCKPFLSFANQFICLCCVFVERQWRDLWWQEMLTIHNHCQRWQLVTTYIGETYIADDSVQFLFREGFINLFENDLQRTCQERMVQQGLLFKASFLKNRNFL